MAALLAARKWLLATMAALLAAAFIPFSGWVFTSLWRGVEGRCSACLQGPSGLRANTTDAA
jgi:hypothetical protein